MNCFPRVLLRVKAVVVRELVDRERGRASRKGRMARDSAVAASQASREPAVQVAPSSSLSPLGAV